MSLDKLLSVSRGSTFERRYEMKIFIDFIKQCDIEDIIAMLSASAGIALLWILAYGAGC